MRTLTDKKYFPKRTKKKGIAGKDMDVRFEDSQTVNYNDENFLYPKQKYMNNVMAALGGISTLQSVVFQIYCIISIMRCHIF
jgi:hypothetical protein